MTTNSNKSFRTQVVPMLLAAALTLSISGCTLSTDFGGYTFSPATDGGILDAPIINGDVDLGVVDVVDTGVEIDSGIEVDALPVCTPTPEVCNGLDDNCDGSTDENLGSTSCGMGICARTVDNCFAGVPQACAPGSPETTETCNSLDDDCNGSTDENLGTTTCGRGICARSVDNCVAGVAQVCAAGMPSTEMCNGLDDNCNGDTDESLGTTSCGTGVCARTVNNCEGGRAQVCTPGAAGVEICNGLDDNCNGMTDESLGTTSCGSGVCARTVNNCEGGRVQVCTPGQPSREICGDAIDNDCDGSADAVPLLLLGDVNTTNNADLAAQFNAAGFSTTVIDGGSGNVYQGTPPASSFRAVVITPGDTYALDMPAPGQQSILDAYTAQGLGVVMTEWTAYKIFEANPKQWTIMGPALAILQRTTSKGGVQTYVKNVNHPVLAGLPDVAMINVPVYHNVGPAVNGGIVIASDATDPVIVVRDDGGRRVVHFGQTAGYNNVLWTGELYLRQSMVNAARWAAKCEP